MSEEIEKLHALIEDVKTLGAKEAAKKHDLSASSLASTMSVARKLGFDVPSRRGTGNAGGGKPRFDTEIAVKLLDAKVEVPQIAAYVGAKTTRVYAYFRKIVRIGASVPLDEALEKLGLPAVIGETGEAVVEAPVEQKAA